MPNKFLGQHFLKNGAVIEKIIRAIAPERGEIIFEIGAGHGELTLPLAECCAKNNSEIIAIEKDRALAEALVIPGNATAINDDALLFFRSGGVEKRTRGKRYKVVGNIPYYLTGHLLRTISEQERMPARCVFMVQKEVAERVVARPPKMNRLAASVQYWAKPNIAAVVPKENFQPMPKVDSAILVLEQKEEVSGRTDPAAYYAAIRDLFSQPRKTVLNNLAIREREKEKVRATLSGLGIDAAWRPQNLTVAAITSIAKAFS